MRLTWRCDVAVVIGADGRGGLDDPTSLIVKQEIVMTKFFARFVRDECGATAVEYGLIAALIGVVIIAGASTLGSALNSKFSSIGSTVSNAGAAS
jgi:pilus assembly protein Flp/PilA